MTTDQVLEIVKARGLRLVPDGPGIKLVGPKAAITATLVRVLKLTREDLVARVNPRRDDCPGCKGRLDHKARCWALKCGYRKCMGCERNTGSVFIATCILCDFQTDPD